MRARECLCVRARECLCERVRERETRCVCVCVCVSLSLSWGKYGQRCQKKKKRTSEACCSVLQYVAVCCSMLQYVAACCSVKKRKKNAPQKCTQQFAPGTVQSLVHVSVCVCVCEREITKEKECVNTCSENVFNE